MREILKAAIILCALDGCALSEDSADVSYRPTAAASIPAAGPVGLTVLDQRSNDRTRISTKINGYGMDMAAIRSSRPVTDVVRDALEAEFKERGFAVGTAGPAVTVGVERFYSTYHFSFASGTADAQVDLAVAIAGASGSSAFSRIYTGSAEVSVMIANGSNAADALSKALQDALQKMFSDEEFLHAIEARPTVAPTS